MNINLSTQRWLSWSKRIDRVNEVIAKIAAHATIFMVLVSFTVTILRYVFNIGFIALQESILYFHGVVFLLSAAYALRHNYHVRIDLFHHKMEDRKKAKIEILGILLFLFPSMIFCLVIAWKYVAISWSYFEGSKETGGLDLVFLLKALLILMPLMLILQGVADLIRNALFIQGKIDVGDWK